MDYPEVRFVADYDNLLKSREFINVLAGRKGFKRAIVFQLKQLQNSVKNTISEIDKELETF